MSVVYSSRCVSVFVQFSSIQTHTAAERIPINGCGGGGGDTVHDQQIKIAFVSSIRLPLFAGNTSESVKIEEKYSNPQRVANNNKKNSSKKQYTVH